MIYFLRFALILLAFVANTPLLAQYTVMGAISDGTENLQGATIRVMSKASLVASAITDSCGRYALKVKPDVYTIKCSYIGYKEEHVNILLDTPICQVDFLMEDNPEILGTVIVRTHKIHHSSRTVIACPFPDSSKNKKGKWRWRLKKLAFWRPKHGK